MAAANLQASCPSGQTAVRYPGTDVMRSKDISSSPGVSEPSCLAKCTANSSCNSAVLLVRLSGSKTCYLKAGTVASRSPALNAQNESQAVINNRFTVLGCVGGTTPPVTNPPTGASAIVPQPPRSSARPAARRHHSTVW